LELVVAVCVVLAPFGAVSEKVTFAPELEVPPLVTAAVIETVPGLVKDAPDIETLTASDGGAITVAFAVPEALEAVVAAFKLTAYVPASVPAGAPLSIVTDADWPGLSVTEGAESEVNQPEGAVEPRSMVLEEHPEESLFVTETA